VRSVLHATVLHTVQYSTTGNINRLCYYYFPHIATKKLEDWILVEINGGGALYITVYDYRSVSQKCRKDICRIETQKLTANRMLKK
jgi:hypothetical protein